MDRRKFLGSMSAASAAVLAGSRSRVAASEDPEQPAPEEPARGAPAAPATKKWLFWDLWHLDRAHNVELCQGEPTWVREATYVDDVDGLAAWPTVYRDEATGRWRMLYTSRWRPWTLMIAESDDGLSFRPRAFPEIEPEGGKLAPHHVFTLPHGSCGGVYVDPVAADGYRFKVYGHQQGKPVAERAAARPGHRWHALARDGRVKPYMAEELTLVSRDAVHWEVRPEMGWGLPDWHPEPPVFGFYNAGLGRHAMTVRPGWGDRRVCIRSTDDFRNWSGPELLLQPDPLDDELCELYGMPVVPYAGYYVGLLWVFHCEQSEPTKYFNRSTGPIDCQLAYSYDGVRFTRGLRRPFIPVNPPGEHGCGGIEPSCLVETDRENRIYSSGSKVQHGRNFLARRAGLKDFEGILVHTLRKDGFTYLASRGDWARLVTKPLVLFEGELRVNVEAPFGGVLFQLSAVDSTPIEGFTFEECVALERRDELDAGVEWKQKQLAEVAGRPVRLEVKFRDARLYAFSGKFHFLDAQDMHLLTDGQPIDPTGLDF